MILGKALMDEYLPLAVTLTTEEIFTRFDGSISEDEAIRLSILAVTSL
jgi:adenosylmethionine-8-amino-7-oxononanoate aminotransferase